MATKEALSIESTTSQSGREAKLARVGTDDVLRVEDLISSDVMRVDPDLETDFDEIDKLDPKLFPPDIQKIIDFDKLKATYRRASSLSILVTGKTGSGKSTLTNGILGLRVNDKRSPAAVESGDIDRACTTLITKHQAQKGKISVTVWDSPGLQDGTTNQDEYLRRMKELCRPRDLAIYCVRITEGRFIHGEHNPDVVAMKRITDSFGNSFWRTTIIVLTFANTIEAFNIDWEDLPGAEKAEAFGAKIEQWRRQIQEILLQDVRIPREIVDNIRITPAGHYRKPHLLNCTYWLSNLWFQCLTTIPSQEARAAMVITNANRFKRHPERDDFKKSVEDQPIVVPSVQGHTTEESSIRAAMKVIGEVIGGPMPSPAGWLTAPLGVALDAFLR